MYYFRADGNENIGLGHIMRCCAVAEELVNHGKEVMFIIAPDSSDIAIKERGYKYYRLKNSSKIGWSSEEFCKWLKIQNDLSAVVVLDSYRVDYSSMKSIREVAKLVYIDDLAMFDYPADAIINYNIEANEQMYSSTNINNRELFLGTRYFPCRSEFKNLRKNAISKKVEKILLTCSSTDPVKAIYLLIKSINPDQYKEIEFNILVGKFFANDYVNFLRSLSDKYSNVNLLPWGQNMAQLLYAHDLLIAPGSTIMLESFIIGTPCMSFYFVDNQIALCTYANQREMAFTIGDITDSNNHKGIQELFDMELDYSSRKKQFEKFSKEFDSEGCYRIRTALERLHL